MKENNQDYISLADNLTNVGKIKHIIDIRCYLVRDLVIDKVIERYWFEKSCIIALIG